MRYLITFSYDGTNYQGYQKQKNKCTIQDNIEMNLSKIFNRQILISASGRTDSGVHAYNQKAHFDIDKEIDTEKIRNSLNKLTNNDIYIKRVEKVDDNFHARFDVLEKEYVYKINLGEYNPIDKNFIYQYNKFLDIEKMKEATKYFIGTHNFKAVTKIDSSKNDFVRTIYDIDFNIKESILEITFRGNGFLRYMVRNIVGLLIEVGNGKRKVEEIEIILKSEDRMQSGITAPPEGLYLKNVKYR